jgi:hypothetical protein
MPLRVRRQPIDVADLIGKMKKTKKKGSAAADGYETGRRMIRQWALSDDALALQFCIGAA